MPFLAIVSTKAATFGSNHGLNVFQAPAGETVQQLGGIAMEILLNNFDEAALEGLRREFSKSTSTPMSPIHLIQFSGPASMGPIQRGE